MSNTHANGLHKIEQPFQGVYHVSFNDSTSSLSLYTENLVPGYKVYDERLIKLPDSNIELRSWNPWKSKLAAAIYCGLKMFAFQRDSKILYLGAATGTTASHISDICKNGIIYCIEFSAFSMRSLISVCEKRQNMIPLLRDARLPNTYLDVGKVDIIYQDVAQPDQVRIIVLNSEKFLKNGGIAYLCLKARSIDVSKHNNEIYSQAELELKRAFDIIEKIDISRYEKDHMFYVLKKTI